MTTDLQTERQEESDFTDHLVYKVDRSKLPLPQVQTTSDEVDDDTEIQIETASDTLATPGPICPVCDQSLGDHPYPIHQTCFDNLKPCTDCGARTGRKGEYDFENKRQHGHCQKCAQRRAHEATTQLNTNPHSSFTVHWETLAQAENVLVNLRKSETPGAIMGFERLYQDAENACDLEDFATMNERLYFFRKHLPQFALARQLAKFAYRGREGEEKVYILEGWALDRYEHALNLLDAAEYAAGFQVADELNALVEYEKLQIQATKLSPNLYLELSRILKRQEDARKAAASKMEANRNARLEYLKNREAAAPTGTAPLQSEPQIRTHPCENCGQSATMRFCNECWDRLPTCPSCQKRKVHVDRDGNPRPNCSQCYEERKNSSPQPVSQNTSNRSGNFRNSYEETLKQQRGLVEANKKTGWNGRSTKRKNKQRDKELED